MNIISGIEKGMEAIGTGVSQASHEVWSGLEGSAKKWLERTGAEFDDVGRAFRSGKLLHAGAELAELLSPGVHVANTLDAIGFLDATSANGNALSAFVNGATAGASPVAWLAATKDLYDASAVAGRIPVGAPQKMADAHCPERPELAQARAAVSHRRGYPTGDRLPSPPPLGTFSDDQLSWMRVCANDAERGVCLRLLERRWNLILTSISWVPRGPSCREIPLAKRSISDILNDATLCFEDRVAMFLAKIMDDMQERVTEQMKRMAAMQQRSSVESAPSPEELSKPYTAIKDRLADGNVASTPTDDVFQQALAFIRPALPILTSAAAPSVGTAVGAAFGSIVPGAGTAIGAAIGGVVSAALPVVVPMLFDASQDTPRTAAASLSRFGRHALKNQKDSEGAPATKPADAGTLQMEMESLKLLIQRMQQMQQACSNILNTMHNGTMNVVRNIR